MDEKLEQARRRWLAQRDDASEREYHVALERAGWPWETAHLQRVGGWRLERVLCGYTQGAHVCSAAAFSRDGRLLVTSDESHVRAWDVATRRRVRGGGPVGGRDVLSLCPSPDGVAVLLQFKREIGGPARSPELWRLDPWSRLSTFAIEGVVCHDATHLMDGRIVTLHRDGVARLWSAGTVERELLHGNLPDPSGRNRVVARPGGGFVTLVGDDPRPVVWSVEGTRVLQCERPQGLSMSSSLGLAVSHDDRHVATSWTNEPGGIALFDLATGRVVASRAERCGEVAFSTDTLVLGSQGVDFFVLDRADLTDRETLSRESVGWTHATSPDGRLACLGGELLDTRSWQPVAPVAHRGRLDQVGFIPNTRRVVSASGPALRTWDQETGRPGWSLPGSLPTSSTVQLESPAAGALVLAGDQTQWIDLKTFETCPVSGLNATSVLAFPSRSARGAHVSRESVAMLDFRSGQRLWEWEWAADEAPFDRFTSGTRAAFSSDDRRLFLAGHKGIRGFDGARGDLLFMVPWPAGPLGSGPAQARAIAASPVEQTLAVVTTDARLVTFNASTGALRGVARLDGPAHRARLSADADVLFLEDDRGWRAVDVRTGRAVASSPPELACPVDFRLPVEVEERACALAVSEDGKRLLLGTDAGGVLLFAR